MNFHGPLLSLLIWIPLLGAGLILGTSKNNPLRAKRIALLTAVVCLALCVPLYAGFDINTSAMQFVEKFDWIPAYGIYYALGVDGLSAPLIILTCITTLVVVFSSWNSIKQNVSQFFAAFLTMQCMMVGMFAATDSVLFYVFWEGMLIPMYLSIGIWGSANRGYASIKFFLYTFLGSALMLVAILYMGIQTKDFSIASFYQLKMGLPVQIWVFLGFVIAFAVKVPMWPVHTWLPDAHTEAPTGGSVVLAALMLKMGAYGFLRFNLPITPDASHALAWVMLVLALIAIVYIGLVAIVQADMKRLIAYSSIAHMGFVVLGCFMVFEIIKYSGIVADAYMSVEGAMTQMVSHAFSTGALFISVGILYDRMHTRLIKDFGGVANSMPVYASLVMLFAMANVGLPGTSGFVGEFMIILSAFRAQFWVTVFAASTLILSAAYTLWMYKRVFFGAAANEAVAGLKDIRGFELAALLVLAGMVLFLGVYPEALLRMFHASVAHILDLSIQTKL